MSLLRSASAPVQLFTTATAFLEDHEAQEIFVPTNTPADDTPEPPVTLLQEGHALSSSTFFPPDSNGFILSRIVENGYTLELQWLSFTKGSSHWAQDDAERQGSFTELDDEPSTLPPIRFVFPARLIPSPAFVVTVADDGTRELQLYAVTEKGYLYALRFTQPRLFYSLLENEEWCEEFKITSLEGKLPLLVHGVDEARIVVACADGFTSSVVIADGANTLIETELRSTASFSVRSLIPSFSTRNLGSPSSLSGASLSSPSQLLSVASLTTETGAISFAFAVSRDRKLKIWDLESGSCLKAIDLPKPSSASSALVITSSAGMEVDFVDSPSTPRPPKMGLLLPPTPQPFVKLVAGFPTSPFASYLVLFVPASSTTPPAFFIYGIANDEVSGALTELTPVGEKVCAAGSAALVDFEVRPFAIGKGGEGAWTLWTVWEEGGESEVRTAALPELEGVPAGGADEWMTVDRGVSGGSAQWTTAHFDEVLEGNTKGIAEVFVEHIAFPGRYPPATLDYALQTYEEALDSELRDSSHRPEALDLFYESVLERICAVVGSTVELEQSAQTGAYLYDAYNKRLKVEWLRFVAMLNQSRAAALFPTSLAVDDSRRLAFVVLRDAIAAPIVQETALTLRQLAHLSEEDEQRVAFLNYTPEALEGSYFHLAQRGLRNELFTIIASIEQLTATLSAVDARNLESELMTKVRMPLAFSVEETALDIYERALEPHLGDETVSSLDDKLRGLLTPEGSFQTLWAMLTTSEVVHPARDDDATPSPSSDLTNAILTDALATSIEARYQLAKGLAILLLFVYGEEDGLIPEIASLTSASFATLHTLASLRWVAQQSAAPSPESIQDQDVLGRFGDMRVTNGQGDDGVVPTPSFSLLNGLLRTRYSPPLSISVPLSSALTQAMSSFLSSTGLITQKRLVVDSPSDVEFALRLRQLGLPALALDFVNAYPRGAGMLYVRGLAELDLGRSDEAHAAFLRAAPALFENAIRLDEDNGISRVLPFEVAGSLGRYYRHIVSLFVEAGVDSSVVKFARLAIESLAEEGVTEETIEKDLWLKLFRSNAALGFYEDAYTTLMTAPHNETKSSCLAHLISVMCENGEVELLTRLSFVGLEADLERNLAFRARNSDPLASPNYYKILYAYHIAKGDYRSAGTIMFQQGRRIQEISGRSGSFRTLATLQCQSYLAAANALSLVATEHAWIAVAPVEDGSDRSNKRRKISYEIPEEEFAPSASRAPEIIELADIRREYTVALSRLQLSTDFPELERTNFSLEPDAVVALFSQTNAFDQAFVAARTLDVDLASLFEILAERCVGLSLSATATDDASWVAIAEEAATWEGSLVSKAWRLLERHLERHDTDGTYRYRLVVLERTLATNRGARVPTFLTDFFLANDSHALIRTLIKYDRLEDAFKYSLTTIKSAPTAAVLASCSLPYSLFDQLLLLKAADSSALSASQLRSKQQDLQSAIEMRLAALEKANRTALK